MGDGVHVLLAPHKGLEHTAGLLQGWRGCPLAEGLLDGFMCLTALVVEPCLVVGGWVW